MITSTRDPLPDPPTEFQDLPGVIQAKILKIGKDETWARAIKNLVQRERMKIEEAETSITVLHEEKKKSLFGGYYTEVSRVNFNNLEHIRERMEYLNMLQDNPMEWRPPRLRSQKSIDEARVTLRRAESQLINYGLVRTADIHKQMEKDVKTVNYLNILLKKIKMDN